MATNEFELMRFCRDKNERYHMTKVEMDYADDYVRTTDRIGKKEYGRNVSFIYNYEFSAFEYILDECINEARRVYYGAADAHHIKGGLYSVYIAVVNKKNGFRASYSQPQLKPVTKITLPIRTDQREGYTRALTESIKKRGFTIVLFI